MPSLQPTLEQQLIGLAWTSPDIYDNLATLCDFGSRFGGTESERQARDWLLHKFGEYSLSNPHLDGFEYTGWYRGPCRAGVQAPQQRELKTAIALVYSPSTPEGGLSAEVIDLGTGSEAEFAIQRDAIAGKIVLVSSGSPPNGPWIHRREKYGRAVDSGAVGFVFMNHLPGLLAPTGSLRPGRLGEIPAIGLAHEEGFTLQRWCRHGPVRLSLDLHNETRPTEAHHVIAEIPGTDRGTIIIGAHYDGHDISQGAIDDGSGVALLLELARLFSPLAGTLRRNLRFIAFAVEELGVLGSTEYVRQHRAEKDDWALMFNLDGGVGPGPYGFSTSGFSEVTTTLVELSQAMDFPLLLEGWIDTTTDAFPFFMAGVPALNLITQAHNSAVGRGYGHTAADTLDKVDPVHLKGSAAVAARVLLRLADYEASLGVHRSQGQLRQILMDHGLERPLRAQAKWPFD